MDRDITGKSLRITVRNNIQCSKNLVLKVENEPVDEPVWYKVMWGKLTRERQQVLEQNHMSIKCSSTVQ
jgi:hypothetical protein